MEAAPACLHSLFRGVSQAALDRALAQGERVSRRKGSVIYSPQVFRRCLGLLLRGRVRVSKDTLVVSTLRAGELFGAAALFNEYDGYAVTLTALTDCEMLFLPQEAVLALLRESPDFAENYVRYLSGRIRFLSSRVDALAGGSAVEKLAQYLWDNQDACGALTLPAAALCKRLSLSRASLYRAFGVLEEGGAIQRTGKVIQILDPVKLQSAMEGKV